MDHKQYEHYHESKSHTPLNFPYNTYLCSIPLDFRFIPTHWHREMEIIVIKKGCGLVTLNLESLHVAQGDIILVLPGQLHSIYQDGQHSMEYENIFFKQELLRTGTDDICHREFLEPFFGGMFDIPSHITPEHIHYNTISYYIKQLDDCCSEQYYGYQMSVKGILFQLLFFLINRHPRRKAGTKRTYALEKLKLILSYIETHYMEHITISEIAGICHYSDSHFMKFFKDCMGISFCQYVNEYRLQIAAQLLKESDETILSVSSSCGFDSLSYFNRIFKKQYGISPGKYRKI